MSGGVKKTDGICILSLDGSGPGSLSQLQIITEYMTRLAIDRDVDVDTLFPADLFDLMGGVAFGGYIALLLGPLHMNVNQATEEVVTLGTILFPEGQDDLPPAEEMSKRLREGIEDMLERHKLPIDIKLKDDRLPGKQYKTVLFATPTANMGYCHLFRSYSSREQSFNPSVVEATCATLSMTSVFSPVSIGPPRRQQTFTSASFGFNNPTKELIKEAEKRFGKEARVASVISVGSGRPHTIAFDTSTLAVDHRHHAGLLNRMAFNCEEVARELSSQLFNVDAYLRINVNYGVEDVSIFDWNDLGSIETHTRIYLDTPAATNAVDISLRAIQSKVGSITLEQLNRSTSIKVQAKRVPAVSPYFVLRKDLWDMMEQHLITPPETKKRIIAVLSGIGGSGKTQMVSYFVQQHHAKYKHVFFVDASAVSCIRSDLQAAIRALGPGHERQTYEDALAYLNSGAHDGKWLLILDNADDPNIDLVPFLPSCYDGTIIITTRNPAVGRLAPTSHLELGAMNDEEALDTLTRAAHRKLPLSHQEYTSWKQLIKELGNLAVALVQAGSYCYHMSSDGGYTFEQYLSLFQRHRSELMKRADSVSLDNYCRGAYTTFDLSYSLLPEPAQQFLHLSGFFYHTDISLSMFECSSRHDFADFEEYLKRPERHEAIRKCLRTTLCPDGYWNELRVHENVQSLRSFSLVSTTSLSNTTLLRFHPLVHAWSRDSLCVEDAIRYKRMATQIVSSCTTPNGLVVHRALLPHVTRMIEKEADDQMHVNDLMAFGGVLSELGNYVKAEGLYQTARAVIIKELGVGHNCTAEVSSRLSIVYNRQGKWAEGEQLLEEVLEQRRITLGNDHPDSIGAAANLAAIYQQEGRLKEAEKLALEVWKKRQSYPGKEHPDSISAAANLAWIYHELGRQEEAERLQAEAVELSERLSPKEHPDRILFTKNLATIRSARSLT